MTTYRGGCHCGAVRYEAYGELTRAELCNCSICTKTGYLHWYVDPQAFRLQSGAADITTYQFGTRTAKHHFCCHCGVVSFRRARSDPNKFDINVRCLDGVNIDALEIVSFDGENWEASIAKRSFTSKQ